ncbi:hypothetical protein ACHAXT_006494 [Thalassiosira profunda]
MRARCAFFFFAAAAASSCARAFTVHTLSSRRANNGAAAPTFVAGDIAQLPPASPLRMIATLPPEDKKKRKKRGKDLVAHVESIEDYKKQVVEENACITVVRFYSRYCKSCQASEPLFYKLAADFSDHGEATIPVKFVEVPLNPKTKVLHEALEVPSLPWTHIYHPDAGLVEERKVSKKHIDDVRSCLRCYVYGECDLSDAPANCINVYGECDIDDGPDGSWE